MQQPQLRMPTDVPVALSDQYNSASRYDPAVQPAAYLETQESGQSTQEPANPSTAPNAANNATANNSTGSANPAKTASAPGNSNSGQSPNVVDSRITTVTQGMPQLPNQAGQVWRSYDISPYTYSVQTRTRPEQALVDWILKETGTEMWFAAPLGILSATKDKLHVYHTPAVQERIKPIVDRFVQSRGRQLVVGMRLMTIASPNWRASAITMMQPFPVNSAGVEAWLMTKENAAILSGMLRNRGDYQAHNNSDLIVANGQQYNLANTRPVNFTRSIGLARDGSRYETLAGRIDEGYTVDLSALGSLDGRSIEAIIGCDINQIEKLQTVNVDLPTAGGSQPFQLQIPQMVRWNVRERFRWPSDMVLVLSCGVVATPGPQKQSLLGIPSLLNGTRRRADALMFIEYKGLAGTLPVQAGGNPAAQGAMVPVSPRR